MIRCTLCFTSWSVEEDYILHLKAHARINGTFTGEGQARARFRLRTYQRWAGHTLENCKCRFHKAWLECELTRKDI